MDTVYVCFLQDHEEHKKGDVVELPADEAQALIDQGVAEQCEAPEAEALAKFRKEIEAKESRLIESLTKELRSSAKAPAVAKSHDDKPEENFWVLVGKTGSQDYRVREKAFNTIANKYGKKAIQNEGTTTAGGFLVPSEYKWELLMVPGYDSVTDSRVRKVPMGSNKILLPALDQTVTPSNGTSAFYSGVSIGTVAEGSAPGANSNVAFKQVSLTAKKWMAIAQISGELLNDSPISVEQLVTENFKRAAAQLIDWNVFNGSGTDGTNGVGGQMTGIIDHASTIKVARETASDIKLADLAKMYARLHPTSVKSAAWFVNPLAIAKFPVMGASSAPLVTWLPDANAAAAPVMTFLGLPVIRSEALPAVGTAGDVVLADLGYYVLGVNTDIVVDSSTQFAFTSDVITYRLKFRMNGIPQLTAPVKLMNGSDTISPFVQLDDSAS